MLRRARAWLRPAPPRFHQAPLPTALFKSDLPEDPYYRLFWRVDPSAVLRVPNGGLPFKIPRTVNPVADLINQINMGAQIRKRFIVTAFNPVCRDIARILHQHGMISGFRDYGGRHALVLELKYHDDAPVIQRIEPISKKTRRRVWTPEDLLPYIPKSGTYAPELVLILHKEDGVSTVLTAAEAFARRVTGEAICRVW